MPKPLPAGNWLGYSLNMTTASPVDMQSVMNAVLKGRRILKQKEPQTHVVEHGGVEYTADACIVLSDYGRTTKNFISFKSGTEAYSQFAVDASMSARYLAVSAGASASYSLEKTFKHQDQWAFYNLTADTYMAEMIEYADLLNGAKLQERLDSMPAFNGGNQEIVQEWKDFFASFGSHVIVKASYGAMFQLSVWASNTEQSVNEKFSTNITAKYEGITFGGQFDASVKNETQYKTFSEFMQETVSIVGGNPQLNRAVADKATDYEQYKKWLGTIDEDSALSSFTTVELWILMKDASTEPLRKFSNMVHNAYNYITTHPQLYETEVILDIESDWAEFSLLSPSATIAKHRTIALPAYTDFTSMTRIMWGKEHSHKYQRQKLYFYVVNDGSPIDFSVSHGSSGGSSGKGRATVIINEHYVADKITDNNWNTQKFYQKPVTRKARDGGIVRSDKPRSWNDVLDEYLKERGEQVPTVASAESAVEGNET
ncbi:MAC/Perforin domain-containing protein [Suillus clintonianus]|uniref:MAC/Perforin domain-containing protein n=1 Tax=Suillus clintonianus TaxID=1904413 RepID=UPI001B863405|nr:MAC/Perforin domain-containing protein [Suillus clintonianus]KAG2146794.1 MAC/Perforin domain-containing protein [Suillus clintonianus]